MSEIRVLPVPGLPEIEPGADVGELVCRAAQDAETPVRPGDVIVIAQKIVSKAEGRLVPALTREDARAAARREARRIVRESDTHLIVQTHHGLVCANAGVDMSNVPEGTAALLPRDPDASARRIRETIERHVGPPVGVIVSDTFGRTWRLGQTNVAIGAAGLAALRTYEGRADPAGREILVTQIAHLDELASAAELVMDKLDRVPAAIVRGYRWTPAPGSARDLVRPVEEDLFR